MKTLEQIKNEVAVKYCYGSWAVMPLDARDMLLDEIAKQCCDEQIELCAEDLPTNTPKLTIDCILSTPNVVKP